VLSTSDIQLELLKLGEEASKVISPQLPYVQYVPKESVEVEASVKVLSNKVDKLDLFSINNGNGNFSSVLSLDSSSRILKSTFMDLVVIGASAFSTERGFYTFPFEVSGRYIGVASYLEILRRLEGAIKSGYLAFRNLVGYEYALDEVEMDNGRVESLYHLDDVADELRVEAENNIIRSSKEDLLILDGPLFPTPRELSQSFVFSRPKDYSRLNHYGRLTHRWAYGQLVKDRVDLITSRRAVGVVKRLENSKKLAMVSKELFGENMNLNDTQILDLKSNSLCNSSHQLCLIGPLEIDTNIYVYREDTSTVVINGVPKRYAYYAILRIPAGVQTFFRLESMDLQVLSDSVMEVFSSITTSVLPSYIEKVDTMAKNVTKGLFYLSFNVLKDFITFLHDTKLEAVSIAQELNKY
jgi:hypothetical protein